jgi:hypothetical protein
VVDKYRACTKEWCSFKADKNVFLTLRGHNIHCQQRELSKFLMHYHQFDFHAYCRAAGPVSNMASQQEKAFCVLHFEVSRSVITVQREFRAQFKKDAPHKNNVFFKPSRNSRCTVITDLDTSNWSTQKAYSCCDSILEPGPVSR